MLAQPTDHNHTDSGNAARLVLQNKDKILYCHDLRSWFIWDGRRWARDTTDQIFTYARKSAEAYIASPKTPKEGAIRTFARQSLNANSLRATIALAESMAPILAADFDIQPYLLNFLNGTLDLRTSQIQPHDPTNRITKIVHINYDPVAQCPLWLSFIDTMLADRQPNPGRGSRLRAYLQRALGYSITGESREKCIFFLFGAADNGKSTMLSIIRDLMREYSTIIRVESLMSQSSDNNTLADLADLNGVRFAQTSESDKEHIFSQAKLKQICQGGGFIKASRKYENPIIFLETWKLWFDSNRKPRISDDVDQATYNRLAPLELLVSVPEDQIDRDLPNKLASELPGICRWLVAGAKIWYEKGLQRPQEVIDSVRAWAAESDHLNQFIAEYCERGDGFDTTANTLFQAYVTWTSSTFTIESPFNHIKFGERMRLIFNRIRSSDGYHYQGVRLKGTPPTRPN